MNIQKSKSKINTVNDKSYVEENILALKMALKKKKIKKLVRKTFVDCRKSVKAAKRFLPHNFCHLQYVLADAHACLAT